jgi:hypothetical protein
MPEGEDAPSDHVRLRMPTGFSLELDTAAPARLWHAGWRADPAGVRVVIGFAPPARDAVDERHAELTCAGSPAGSRRLTLSGVPRCAIGPIPTANDAGLMSPVEESRRTWPPPQPPAL